MVSNYLIAIAMVLGFTLILILMELRLIRKLLDNRLLTKEGDGSDGN